MTRPSDEQGATTGGYSRRKLLKIGIGVAMGAGVVASSAEVAMAGGPNDPTSPTLATKVKNLTGPVETGSVAAPWTDLGIPVLCPNGTMLFVGGHTLNGAHVPH